MKIEIAIRHDETIAHDVYHGMCRRWPRSSISVQPCADVFSVKMDGEEVEHGHPARMDARREMAEALRIMSAI